MRRTLTAGAILVAGLGLSAPALAHGKTLRFAQNINLTILDPIWTTAYVTRNHGHSIYDTLFAMDEQNAKETDPARSKAPVPVMWNVEKR